MSSFFELEQGELEELQKRTAFENNKQVSKDKKKCNSLSILF
jgi:hypothetical protein